GMGHFERGPGDAIWNTACCAVVHHFLLDLKLGRPPEWMPGRLELPGRSEEVIDRRLRDEGVPSELRRLGTAGYDRADMQARDRFPEHHRTNWERLFASGAAQAVSSAVEVAAGVSRALGGKRSERSQARQARDWFMSAYPLL